MCPRFGDIGRDDPDAADVLRIQVEPSGPRHYLQGRAADSGDLLELSLADGVTVCGTCRHEPWLRGRYDWSFKTGDRPTFKIGLGDAAGWNTREVAEAKFELPTEARLRRP